MLNWVPALRLNWVLIVGFLSSYFHPQSARFIIHVVPQPHQVDSLHNMAQLQVDNYKDTGIPRLDGVSHPLFLFSARLHHQENVGRIEFPLCHHSV